MHQRRAIGPALVIAIAMNADAEPAGRAVLVGGSLRLREPRTGSRPAAGSPSSQIPEMQTDANGLMDLFRPTGAGRQGVELGAV
jgi:hypothetical protein